MKISFALIFSVLLGFNAMAGVFVVQKPANKEQPKPHILQIDTLKQQTIEQIIGLEPGLQVKKCDVVISSHGTIFKLNYGQYSRADSEKKLWGLLKKLHANDVVFIDNIYVIKNEKLIKLTGQKAFKIQ